MQLREIHIDGFGTFYDTHLIGFDSGLNVFFGMNEAGKTTLLEFIRRVLFGFPRVSARINPYPAVSGGAYGGRLVCLMDDQRELVVGRTAGPQKGNVSLRLGQEEHGGQEALNELLRPATEMLYNDIYAITIKELTDWGYLNQDEISERLYGLELGLPNVSPKKVMDEFEAESSKIYKKNARKHLMAELLKDLKGLQDEISELQAELINYDRLFFEKKSLEEKSHGLSEVLRKHHAEKHWLETQSSLFPQYVAMEIAKKNIDSYPSFDGFYDGLLDDLEKLERDIDARVEDIRKFQTKKQELEKKKESLNINFGLVKHGSKVRELEGASEAFRLAQRDIGGVRRERTELESQLKREVASIGETWSLDTLRDFEPDVPTTHNIDTLKSKIDERAGALAGLRTRLDVHRDTRAEKASIRLHGPVYYRAGLMLLAVLGVCGLGAGWFLSDWWVAGFSFAVVGISGLLLLGLQWGAGLSSVDAKEEKLKISIADCEKEMSVLNAEWQKLLSTLRLDIGLSGSATDAALDSIKSLKKDLKTLDSYTPRIEDMLAVISKTEALHDEVAKHVDPDLLTNDIGANIVTISNLLAEAKKRADELKRTDDGIEALELEIRSANASLETRQSDLREFLGRFVAEDEQDLRQKCSQYQKRQQEQAVYENNRVAIQSAVGLDERFDTFIEAMSGTTRPEIEEKRTEIEQKIEQEDDERIQINREIGEINKSLTELATEERLLQLQVSAEMIKSQLQDCAKEWTRSQIALFLLQKAAAQFEKTKQPKVIQAAEKIFINLTGERYSKLHRPLELADVYVLTPNNRSLKVSELSRGTREQLCFAMRLGLINQYEQESHVEKMPVVLDDIFVNFDDVRGPLALETLKNFANNRQVIVMTCHKTTLDVLLKHGARQVYVAGHEHPA